MARRRKVGNLLALALLGVLASAQPMYPYEMASLLRNTGKVRDFEIKWGSLYTVVRNLDRHGFITATGSDRAGRRPERTRYAITDAGRAELTDWVRELIATPDPEHPRFQAALSVAGVLPPEEMVGLLRERVGALEVAIAADRAVLAQAAEVPRILLIEGEYALAIREAEAAWVRALLTELTEGTPSGLAEWRAFHQTGDDPPQWTQLSKELGNVAD